jgi:DNA polymerase-3 subunit delta'
LFGDELPAAEPESLAVSEENPAYARLQSGGHAGMKIIEPEYDEQKQAYKAEISVTQARQVGTFLAQTAGEGSWKVIIIDSIDQMNRSASNAILKWLEEPPERSIFILISHNPGILLPTIRSRCRHVGFAPLSKEDFDTILGQFHIMPSEEESGILYHLSGGAPGLAATLHNSDSAHAYQKLIEAVTNTEKTALLHICEQLTTGKKALPWEDMSLLITQLLRSIMHQATGQAAATDAERPLKEIAVRKSLAYWLDLWENGIRLLHTTQQLHLSKKHTVFNLLLCIRGEGHVLEQLAG